jgi:hypothetical protein
LGWITEVRVAELLGWRRSVIVRSVFASAEVATIAVKTNAVITVFMIILLG